MLWLSMFQYEATFHESRSVHFPRVICLISVQMDIPNPKQFLTLRHSIQVSDILLRNLARKNCSCWFCFCFLPFFVLGKIVPEQLQCRCTLCSHPASDKEKSIWVMYGSASKQGQIQAQVTKMVLLLKAWINGSSSVVARKWAVTFTGFSMQLL